MEGAGKRGSVALQFTRRGESGAKTGVILNGVKNLCLFALVERRK